VSEKKLSKQPKYRTIPVDPETYEKVQLICKMYQTQGALMRKLVNAEFEKWNSVKLTAPVDAKIEQAPQA